MPGDLTCGTCPALSAADGMCRLRPPRPVTIARSGDAGQPVDPWWDVSPSVTPNTPACAEHPLHPMQRERIALAALPGLLAAARFEWSPTTGYPLTAVVTAIAYGIADEAMGQRAATFNAETKP
jgi:hypothetical protein